MLTWTTEQRQLGELVEWDRNPRQLSKHDAEQIAQSIETFNLADPLVINADNQIIGGHQRKRVMLDNGYSADDLVDVRVPSRQLTEKEAEELNIRLNRNSGDWDFDVLANEFELDELLEWGFTEYDFQLAGIDWGEPPEDPGPQIDRAEELQQKWQVQRGQVWEIGRHRLMCGESTDREQVNQLLGAMKADVVLTDPPYCSGGFQEAGKVAGSVGTRGTEMVARDTLSTRGYQALMRRVLSLTDAGVVYVFTDWRMWINLFDLVEASGFGVRNMIVWDKGSPGMGAGWRMQHELILCGIRVKSPFNPKKAQGNVIACGRTGNVNHAVEKPTELLVTILEVTDLAERVHDPFLGSGTTLVACEQTNRIGYGMEIEPKYCSVTLERLQGMGLSPQLVEEN